MNIDMLKRAAEVARRDPKQAYRMVEAAEGDVMAPQEKGSPLPPQALESLSDALAILKTTVLLSQRVDPNLNRRIIMSLGGVLMNLGASLNGFVETADEAVLIQKIAMRLLRERNKV